MSLKVCCVFELYIVNLLLHVLPCMILFQLYMTSFHGAFYYKFISLKNYYIYNCYEYFIYLIFRNIFTLYLKVYLFIKRYISI